MNNSPPPEWKMSASRRIVFRVAVVCLRYVLKLFLRAIGLKRWALGKAEFYGTFSFLELCQQALQELEHRDPELFESIIKTRYLFWHNPVSPDKQDNLDTLFSIPKGYCAWGHAGVSAFVVVAHFKSTLFAGRYFAPSQQSACAALKMSVKRSARKWLAQQNYPAEIVTCFPE